MNLTKRAIDAMRYQGKDHARGKGRDVRWDSALPGLGVRVYPTGRKAFVLSYRHQGRKRLITLGSYGALTLEQARKRARRELGAIVDGGDPLGDRQANAMGTTVAELCRDYLARHAAHKKSGAEDQRRIDQHILPKWANIKVVALKRPEIADLHHRIGERAPYEANRILALIRKMLNLASAWGFVEDGWQNPASGIPMHKEKSRDRWLTADELPRFAQAIDAEPNVYARAAIWLYMLTGVRKSELLNLKWTDIDWDRGELHLGDTKAGRPHFVPLSRAALAVLQTVPRQEGNPYVICGNRKGRPLVNITKPWMRIKKAAGVEDVRLHDLRRTVGSWLAQAGNDLHLIGKVLNHSQLPTTAVYARFSQDVVHQALEAHGERIIDPPPLNWSTSYHQGTEDRRWQSSVTNQKKLSRSCAR